MVATKGTVEVNEQNVYIIRMLDAAHKCESVCSSDYEVSALLLCLKQTQKVHPAALCIRECELMYSPDIDNLLTISQKAFPRYASNFDESDDITITWEKQRWLRVYVTRMTIC